MPTTDDLSQALSSLNPVAGLLYTTAIAFLMGAMVLFGRQERHGLCSFLLAIASALSLLGCLFQGASGNYWAVDVGFHVSFALMVIFAGLTLYFLVKHYREEVREAVRTLEGTFHH